MEKSNPYYVQPASPMSGLKMAIGGYERGKALKAERAKSEKHMNSLADLGKLYQEGSPEELGRFLIKNPDLIETYGKVYKETNTIKEQETSSHAFALLNSSDPVPLLEQRKEEITRRGGDPSHTQALIDDAKGGGESWKKGAISILAQFKPDALKTYLDATGQGRKESTPATDIDDFVSDAETVFLSNNPNATKAQLSAARNKARKEIKRAQRNEAYEVAGAKKTAELEVIESMQPGIERDKEIARYRANKEEERAQKTINDGLIAAESIPNIKRGLQLLETIDTGGFDTISLNVKRFFGAEGADEGELSNRLSKAVLKQLRDTFGAQFTVGEGNKLDRIEAGFNKSPSNNKRLLTSALRMSQGKVNLAIKRAKSTGDKGTIDEINSWVNFSLAPEDFTVDGGPGGESTTVTSQAEYDSLPSGATYTEDGKQYRKP